MAEPIIQVRDLGKRYRIRSVDRKPYSTFREDMVNGIQRFVRGDFGQSRSEDFWALRDVSFDVHQGEVVGIIGRNGAGKSTLLKILSRIVQPTTGEAIIRGRVGSLLEVGTGFHPELTGRENIFMNGAILGMKRAEIKKQFDAIVAFAEVEKFLDTPVKFYSSGMYVRLAFAVAAHLEPEILIVDEVLAVGDAAFQKKCLGKMGEVSEQEGKTVLFVSHNMKAVETLCKTAIILNNGVIQTKGDTSSLAKQYLSLNMEINYRLEKYWDDQNYLGNNLIRINSIRAIPDTISSQFNISCTTPFKIEIVYTILVEETPFILALHLKTLFGEIIFATESKYTLLKQGIYKTECLIPDHFLNGCSYTFSLYFDRGYGSHLYKIEEAFLRFDVFDDLPRQIGVPFSGEYPGVVRPQLQWKTSSINNKGFLQNYAETINSDCIVN